MVRKPVAEHRNCTAGAVNDPQASGSNHLNKWPSTRDCGPGDCDCDEQQRNQQRRVRWPSTGCRLRSPAGVETHRAGHRQSTGGVDLPGIPSPKQQRRSCWLLPKQDTGARARARGGWCARARAELPGGRPPWRRRRRRSRHKQPRAAPQLRANFKEIDSISQAWLHVIPITTGSSQGVSPGGGSAHGGSRLRSQRAPSGLHT